MNTTSPSTGLIHRQYTPGRASTLQLHQSLFLPALEGYKTGQLQTVQRLLGEGVDLNAEDSNGQNALHQAAYMGRTEIAEAFVGYMYSDGLDARNVNGQTALHLAAGGCHLSGIEKLLEYSAAMEIKDRKERAALHYAAYYGQLDIVYALLKSGPKSSLRTVMAELLRIVKWQHQYTTASYIQSWE
jgi:ankyrin repeat protein